MRGKRGSVLAITVGFVLAFTMLGFQAIYLTGLNRELTQKQASASKAFWLAEAGVQRAFARLPYHLFSTCATNQLVDYKNIKNTNPVYLDGERCYAVSTDVVTPGKRWLITARSWMPIVVESGEPKIALATTTKSIQAEVGVGIIDAFQTTGTLKDKSEQQIIGTYSENNPPFDFLKIFKREMDEIKNDPETQHLTGSVVTPEVLDNGNPIESNKVIWVEGDLKVTNGTGVWNHLEGLLIVNGNFEMTGGSYDGVIWVQGEAKMIEGNPGVTGAIFVNDPAKNRTSIDSSMATITYSEDAIDAAFDAIGTDPPDEAYHNLINWQELG